MFQNKNFLEINNDFFSNSVGNWADFFFQISDLSFVAAYFKILFLQFIFNLLRLIWAEHSTARHETRNPY